MNTLAKQPCRLFVAACLIVALVVLGCGGGGGRSPTEPSGRSLVVSVAFGNASLARTIQDVSLALDGRVVATFVSQQATDLAILGTTPSGVSRGPHTFTIKMIRQTRSPSRYHFVDDTVLVGDTSGRQLATIRLGAQDTTLTNGQSIDYRATIP